MTAKAHKIGMLGAGNMAGALIRGLLAAKTIAPENLRASDPREKRLAELSHAHGIDTTSINDALVDWADVVVLAVKPQVLPRVLDQVGGELGGKLLVSIAAGVTTAAIGSMTAPGTRVIRTMPNTAAIALCGATAITAGPNASASDLDLARELFEAVGRTAIVGEELLDAVTGLSGSGPAYVMILIEALADGGVKEGLPREVALELAAQTVYGAAKLLLERGEHPARLKDMVTSPGGTTIAGVAALERAGFRHACLSAVEAATQRSRELGAAGKK